MYKLFLIFIYSIPFILYGCGSGIKSVKVNLQCDEDCNDNNAIVVKIYQLKNSDKFSHASFESILRNPEAVLAEDLIPNSKFEITMIPGQNYKLNDYKIKNEAAYIGVVGDFHSPATDGWLQVIPLSSGIDPVKIFIHKNYLTIEKND